MKLTTEEMRRLYQQQTAQSFAGRADCLSEEAMMRAAMGELSEGEREQIADHLADCSECVQEYRLLCQLKPWAERAAAFTDEPLSTIKQAAAGLGKEEWDAAHRPGWRRHLSGIFSHGSAGYALAAALFIISLGCVTWIVSSRREQARVVAQLNEQLASRNQASETLAETRRQLEETSRHVEQQQSEIDKLRRSVDDLSHPQANVPIVDLEHRDGRSIKDNQITTVLVPEGANLLTLILHVTGRPSFPDYALEISDGRGQRVWRIQGLRRSLADTFTVTLPRQLFPAGRYRIQLDGISAGRSKPVGDYSLRIRYP